MKKNKIFSLLLSLVMMFTLTFATAAPVYAVDGFPDPTPTPTETSNPNATEEQTAKDEGQSISDFLQENNQGVLNDSATYEREAEDAGATLTDVLNEVNTTGNMKDLLAEPWARQLISIVGKVIDIILVIVFMAFLLLTALDLAYITFPPVRIMLNKERAIQGGGMGMGMGMTGRSQGTLARWVSEEALRVVEATEGGTRQGAGMGAMGSMMGMGGMGMGNPQSLQLQAGAVQSAVKTYLKARAKSSIWLVIAAVLLLFSTVFVDIGTFVATVIVRVILFILNLARGFLG